MAIPLRRLAAAALAILAGAAEAAPSAEDLFRQGINDFRAGDYRQAIRHFRAAREAGLDSPALTYNLGVSYYRLGRYDRATRAFTRLTRAPGNRGLAHYNLGLIALSRDRPAQARDHFRTAMDSPGNESVRRLARARLAELAPGPEAGPAFLLLAGASLGYDDNVVLSPDTVQDTTDADDLFLELLAIGNAQLNGSAGDGLQLKASLLVTDYADLNRFDQLALRAGPEWDRRWGAWAVDLAAYGDLVTLDRSLFELIGTAKIEGRRALGEGLSLRLRMGLSRIEAESPYAYLSGWRQRAGAELRWQGPWVAEAGYELERNDREDQRTATGFTSASPIRHELHASATYRPARRWRLRLRAALRLSRYADANTDSATGLDKVREDRRLRLTAGLRRDLNRQWSARAALERTANDSNLAGYDYTANAVRLGLERFF
jgi:tetratricopeptide (TPR) repeat protein